MGKLILVSFADRRFRNAVERLRKYTKVFPFDEWHFHTQDDCFSKEYWKGLKPWLYRRGYGYWDWKARLVKYYYDQMNVGDIVVWSDVGVYWNASTEALKRFSEYVESLDSIKSILAFQEPYMEQEWTKGDLLKAMSVYDNEDICCSNQLWSGCFFVRKDDNTRDFIEQWVELNDIQKELITDKRSEVPNKEGFKEHRHDQSSFSLLVKQIPHVEVLWQETQELNKDWEKLKDFPIQARRHKENARPLSVIIENKLLRPWRICLNIYFRRIRDYDFLGKSYPW